MGFDRTKQRREWGRKNKEKLAEWNKQYYGNNIEKRSEQTKKYRDKIKRTKPEMIMLRSSRHRAKKRGFEFNLEITDIIIPDMCSVLDIPLFFTTGEITNNTPSIDRIDSSKGYTKGNIRIISSRANTIKNNATIEEIELVLKDLIILREQTNE